MTLYALKALEADMGWLLTEEMLSLQTGRQLPDEIRQVQLFCLPSVARLTGTAALIIHNNSGAHEYESQAHAG